MAEFHFLRPYWLLSVLPALFIWLGFLRHENREAEWGKDIDPHLLKHLLVGQEEQSWFRPVHLFIITLLLTSFSLAGPTWKREPSPFLDDTAGLLVLLKVSSTMEATDVQPSRLTRAKQKIRDLLKLRKGAATGLIVYSGSAHLVMPPTRDDRIINTMLEDLTPALMPANGDNIEQALQLSRQLFEKSGQPGSLLVIADTVSGTKSLVSQEEDIKLPVQFLAVQPPSADINKGLQKAASKLGAKIIRMRVDAIDVETIAKNAANDFTSAGISDQGERWHDSGYAFLPIIALCILVWFRKGWVLS